MFSFLSKPISGSSYWEGLYLLFAVYLLTHPPLAYPQAFAVALGGGLVLLLFRSVPSENFKTVGLFGLLFLLYSLASTCWSAAPGFSLQSAGVLFLAVLLYLMNRQSNLQSQARVEMVLLFFALGAAIMGLYQWFFGFGELAELLPQYSGVDADQLTAAVHNKRAFGPLVTSGALAALLIFELPQLLVRCWTASGFKRILFALASLGLLAGLAATGGVGAWVCLGLVLGFLLYRQGAKTWVLGVAGLSVVILALLLWHRGFHSWALASYSMRLELWRSAWILFLKKPWFGWGLGAFGEAYQSVGLPLDSGALFAHDLPLQLLVETGLVGTFLAAAAVLSCVLRFKWPSRWEGWGVMGGLLAVSLFSFIDLPFQMTELVWVFAGVAGRLELKPEKSWKIPQLPVTCVPWVVLAVLTVTGFWPPYRPWNFALLAVCLWTAFALLEAQVEAMSAGIGLGALYLALRAFDSPSASGAVWFLELCGLLVVFYLLIPKFEKPKRFLAFFTAAGLLWALKLGWYCWREAPKDIRGWIKFQITDVEPWVFHPNPKHLGIFLIPFFFLAGSLGLSSRWKNLFSVLAGIIVLRLKALSALAGLSAGWLWGFRKSWTKLLAGSFIVAAGLLFLRAVNSSATKWGRLDIWRSAWKVGSQSPWWGVGPGVFSSAFHQVQEPTAGVSRYLMDARYAHNEFIDLWVAFGTIGTLLVLWFLWRVWRQVRDEDRQKALWGLTTASLVDFCLHTPLIALMATGLSSPEKRPSGSSSGLNALLAFGLALSLFAAPAFAPELEKQSQDWMALKDYRSAVRCQNEAASLDPWNIQTVIGESELYEQFYLAIQDEAWRSKSDDSFDRALGLEKADGELVFAKAKRWARRYETNPTAQNLATASGAWAEAEKSLPLNSFVTFEEGFFWVKAGQLTHKPLWAPGGYGSKVLECYGRSAVLEPNFAAAWLNLGLSHLQQAAQQKASLQRGKTELREALRIYRQWKDAPGLSPEERQLVDLPPGEARWLSGEVSR